MTDLKFIRVLGSTAEVSQSRAEQLSQLIYHISMPELERPSWYKTTHRYPIILHPDTGYAALVISNEAEQYKIHKNVELTKLLSVLSDHSKFEKERIKNWIEGNKEGKFKIKDILPAGVDLRNYNQMESDGWFLI